MPQIHCSIDWHESIKPNSTSEILGNYEIIDEMKKYIITKKTGQVILVQGPSGVGKTTAVNLILKELGYRPISIYLSGEHTTKTVDDLIKKCVGSPSILDWGKKIKLALVIDELECLQIHHKQLLLKLLQIHPHEKCLRSKKKNKKLKQNIPRNHDMPVIFICNLEYHRSLEEIEKYAETFKFSSPTIEDQFIWCQTIGMIRDIRLTNNVVNLIIEKSKSDIRQLSYLLFLVWQQQAAGDNLIKIRKTLRNTGDKNINLHLYDLLHKTITQPLTLNTALAYYQQESILLPWMIYENVYKYFENAHFNCTSSISTIADMVSQADLLWEAGHANQVTALDTYYGAISAWSIPVIVRKELPQHLRKKITFNFPKIMIKRSQIKMSEGYNAFLLEKTVDSNIDIHYLWSLFSKLSVEKIAEIGETSNISFIEFDRIEKIGSFQSDTKWNSSFKKKLKELLE